MKLYVIANYKNRDVFYKAGRELTDLSEEEASFLMRDAPGCFSKSKPKEEPAKKAKAKKEAPKDKAVKGGKDK